MEIKKIMGYVLGSFVSVLLAVGAGVFLEPAPDSVLTVIVAIVMVVSAVVALASGLLSVVVFTSTSAEEDEENFGFKLAKITYWAGFFLLPSVISFLRLASAG